MNTAVPTIPIMTDLPACDSKCCAQEAQRFAEKVENLLLSKRIVSLDGSDGMDHPRARLLAAHLGAISARQARDAWAAGILKLGR